MNTIDNEDYTLICGISQKGDSIRERERESYKITNPQIIEHNKLEREIKIITEKNHRIDTKLYNIVEEIKQIVERNNLIKIVK